MALTRYYRPEPTAVSPYQWLSGFLQGQQASHTQEAQMDAAANMQAQRLYASGLSSLFAPVFQVQMQKLAGEQALQRQQAATAGAQQLEQLRQMGYLNRAAVDDYQTAYGPLPAEPSVQPAPSQQGAPAGKPTTLVPGAGEMPSDILPTWQQWPSATVPAQQQPQEATVPRASVDPAYTPQYQEDYEKLQRLLSEKRALVDTNPFLSSEERASRTAAYAPEVARLTKTLSGYKPPRAPKNFGELVAQGKALQVPNTNTYAMQDRYGAWKMYDAEQTTPAGQSTKITMTDGTALELPRNSAQIVTLPDGSTIGVKTDNNGKPDFEKLAPPKRPFDRSKFIEKVIGTIDPTTGQAVGVDEAIARAGQVEAAIKQAEQREEFANIKSPQQLLEHIYGDDLTQARKMMSQRSMRNPFTEQDAVAARSMAQKIVDVMRMYNDGQVELADDLIIGLRREMEFLREIARPSTPGLAPLHRR